jgi:glycine/D-amino acid oxidase-like deaminating enzyme
MHGTNGTERFETVIIGGGQAGLSVGYHLAKRGRPFVILDANERIGDSWRKRWDSLRVFTPARYNGLPGWAFPAPARSFPTKEEVADYLEAYAARFELPVRSGVHVEGVSKKGNRYFITAGDRFEADHVVVATGAYRTPRVPAFARELDCGSCRCIPVTTGTLPSCGRVVSWSSEPATRGPRSRSKRLMVIRRGWPAGTQARSQLDLGACRTGCSFLLSGSWPRACLP